MKTLTRLGAATLALLTIPALALAVTRATVWAPNCNKAQYKPRQLILACLDGSNYLTKLQWQGWSRATATGAGVDEVNDCSPDCATGHFHAYPVTVTLSQPRRCGKVKRHEVFSHIVVNYPGAHPGRRSKQGARLFCPF